MKEIILPLENHNIFNFQASTCPEGVKFFYEKNHYLLLRNLISPDEKFNMIEKKVSNAIMKSVYCSLKGNLKLVYPTNEPLKIQLNTGYFTLNLSDGFLFDRSQIKPKINKKLFLTPKYGEIFFLY